MYQPNHLFIRSPLNLVPKDNGSWHRICNFSHRRSKSVNNYIPDGAGKSVYNCIPDGTSKTRYTCFQKVLQLVINARRHCIILKKEVKDVYKNVTMALQH